MLEVGLDDGAVVELLALVGTRPVLGAVLDDHIELTGHEGFETCDVVFVETIEDAVEVIAALAGRKRTAPVVWIALEHNRTAEVVTLDQVRAAGNRRCELYFVERRTGCPLAREHRHAADDQRQFAVGGLEIKTHRSRIEHHALFDIGKYHFELRRAFGYQRIKRILDVVGQHTVAIVEARQRVEPESHR